MLFFAGICLKKSQSLSNAKYDCDLYEGKEMSFFTAQISQDMYPPGACRAYYGRADRRRTLFHASSAKRKAAAGLTVETAVALPVFLVCMLVVMQYLEVIRAAGFQSTLLSEAAQEMAAAAYATEYVGDESPVPALLEGAYALGKIESAEKSPRIRDRNILLSSFPDEEKNIDLVMTYRVKSAVGMVSVPGRFWVQRACVRSWTGRDGSGESASDEGEDGSTLVYVTEFGSVYHRDLNCRYIRLNIRPASMEDVNAARNNSGEKYRRCEYCGGKSADVYYITDDGNRYHTSLDCSALKRMITQVPLSEAETARRPCSYCGGAH